MRLWTLSTVNKMQVGKCQNLYSHNIQYMDVLYVLRVVLHFFPNLYFVQFPFTLAMYQCIQLSHQFSFWSRSYVRKQQFYVLWYYDNMFASAFSYYFLYYFYWFMPFELTGCLHTLRWDTRAMTKPQRGQEVESTLWG